MYLQHSLHRFGKLRIQAHCHLLQCSCFQVEGFARQSQGLVGVKRAQGARGRVHSCILSSATAALG